MPSGVYERKNRYPIPTNKKVRGDGSSRRMITSGESMKLAKSYDSMVVCVQCHRLTDPLGMRVRREWKTQQIYLSNVCLECQPYRYDNELKRCRHCRVVSPLKNYTSDPRKRWCNNCVNHHETGTCQVPRNGHKCQIQASSHEIRYKLLLQVASKRGIPVEITLKQYIDLALSPCEYCGGNLPVSSYGLDRVDPNLGYIFENVVPCCGDCNRTKYFKFTYEEMKIIGEAIRQVKQRRIEYQIKNIVKIPMERR